MITGILAAFPEGDFFDSVILDMQAIADGPVREDLVVQEVELPQVHALNCLKDIFTDSRFGTATEAFVADSLDIAASCLECHMYVFSLAPQLLYLKANQN